MSGWTVVDTASNKSLPVGGTQSSGTGVPYTAPVPWSQDAVQKMRVSTPQSLIDTDFEYGTQPTKWESISLQNNRQSCYTIPQQPVAVTAITGTAVSNIITITFTGTIPNNTPIYIQNSTNSTINGWAWVVTGGSNTTINVTLAPSATISTSNGAAYFSTALTYVYLGYFYSSCGIQVGSNAIVVNSPTVITITTSNAHGLDRGSLVYLNGAQIGGGATAATGAYIVATTPTYNTFTVTASGAAGSPTNSAGNNVIFARPSGYVEPRAFDGGVAFSAGSAVPNAQLIRQTRRYFRYQSGKGIQFSTGSSLKPPLFVNSVVNSSGTVTVTTRYNHNLVVGAQIQVLGANQGFFNGTFTVATVPTPTTLTYTVTTTTSATATGSGIRVTPLSWFGSSSRLGFFDQQNGIFFEYDGQTLYAVLRNSVNQISGSVSVTQGSATVTGTGTAFLTQVQPGQFIVIRGQTYRVVQIVTNTNITVSPEYRGASISNVIVSQTNDLRIPQSQWNLDKCNGTGPSGYNIDLTRMQMWYIDYSWYGAGYIRWGVRGIGGQITYVHQLQNNNVQFEAYMRSGNMSAHYEVSGISPVTYPLYNVNTGSGVILGADINSTQTTIPVSSSSIFSGGVGAGVATVNSELIYYGGVNAAGTALINCIRGFNGTRADDATSSTGIFPNSIALNDATGFPTSSAAAGGATLQVKAQNSNGTIEYITYTGITSNGIMFGLSRGQTGGGGATTLNGSPTTSIELASPDSIPALSHWGSSAIMDGRYDDDKSLIFNFGTTTAITTTSTTPIVIMALRIAPSVDNGTVGTLGNKETINRMQLELSSLGLYTTGTGYLINLVLNGFASGAMSGSFVSPIQQANGITSSLAQIATNTNAVNVTGGESVYAAYSNTSGNTTLDLSIVRDLGNSILGGGTSNTVPTAQANFYPDGPDILYIVATPLSSTSSTILARLNWKEAQA